VVVTEKIDGTNAQIYVDQDSAGNPYVTAVGSRKRWLGPGQDNFGFYAWVDEHREELAKGLGPGRHFGEWWGAGIQRGYAQSGKTFSLFNTKRWTSSIARSPLADSGLWSLGVRVVPVLATIDGFGEAFDILDALEQSGSMASPGFLEPEGIMLYHAHAGQYFKLTLDDNHKG